jgi:hypothetical protein
MLDAQTLSPVGAQGGIDPTGCYGSVHVWLVVAAYAQAERYRVTGLPQSSLDGNVPP